jgi:cell division transport system ATP-binding protein
MILLNNVSKKFGTGNFALSEINVSVRRGEFVFLVGPTGSGKTTIFRLIIKDMLPSTGDVVVNSLEINKLPKNKLSALRKKIGVIFQDLKLMFDRTVFENVYLPLDVAGVKTEEATKTVNEILSQVGLLEHKDKFPLQLSGGELQRVAVARALALSPEILLADEPTGNLDPQTSWEIVKILSEINKKGTTVIMATHNTDIVKNLGNRVIHLEKGKVVKDEPSTHKALHVVQDLSVKPEKPEGQEKLTEKNKEDVPQHKPTHPVQALNVKPEKQVEVKQ